MSEELDQQNLETAQKEASQLREMMSTPGWKIYCDHVDYVYDEYVKRLIMGEDAIARERIKAISEFRQWPKRILADVEKAQKTLLEQQEETGVAPAE